jgi:predicted regulator of Ras-like GTPase activity (Roadblock/LC7/MglB family)
MISSFFSAIFSFSDKVVSRRLEVLEMGDLRFSFRSEGDFIFTILSDLSVSILFLRTRLERIAKIFHDKFPDPKNVKDYEQIDDPEFDEKVESIITGEAERFKEKDLYKKVIELFKDFQMQNEIIGAAILSTEGNIIYSSLPNDILIRSLKELEIRFKTGVVDLPELFYSLGNGQKVFSKMVEMPQKLGDFLIVLLFEKGVPLGMAELQLNKVGEKIIKLAQSKYKKKSI